MPTAENARLDYEGGQTSVAMAALTAGGSLTVFTSPAALWSRRSGFAPVILPNGLLTGGAVIPAVAAGNDNVDVAALTCNLNGVVTSVAADTDVAITRPATAVSKVCSVTVNSSGAIAVVAGTDGGSAAFSETRAAAGGPPLIPTDSIEIAQVRVVDDSAAVITTTQVFATPGLHVEQAINPSYTVNYGDGQITFISALPAIHTGPTAKAVFASYATPIFAAVPLSDDFVPAANSYQVNSTQIYGTTLGSSSATLSASTFNAYMEDGVTDSLATLEGEQLWWKFFPDRFATPHMLQLGKLGIVMTYPADDNIVGACTIAAEAPATRVAS